MFRERLSMRFAALTPMSLRSRSPRRRRCSPNVWRSARAEVMARSNTGCAAMSMRRAPRRLSPSSMSAKRSLTLGSCWPRSRAIRNRVLRNRRIRTMSIIATIEDLEAIYGRPNEASTVKVADRVTPQYRRLIDKSPFAALATSGPEGLDCSPRGDLAGFVRVHDDKTLMMPDRRGNNRVDSLRNIVRDPRVALLFLIPGSGSTLRVSARAYVSAEPQLLQSFKMDGKAPRTVIVMTVEEIYFQCARAIVRSDLWNPDKRVDPKSLPTPGQILAEMSDNTVGGEKYDREWPERARQTMW